MFIGLNQWSQLLAEHKQHFAFCFSFPTTITLKAPTSGQELGGPVRPPQKTPHTYPLP